MSLGEGFTNAPPSFGPDFFELRRSLIDHGGNFRHLFVSQMKLPAKAVAHSLGRKPRAVRAEKERECLRRAEKNPGRSAGQENQDEAYDQFPLQRPIHCENSS